MSIAELRTQLGVFLQRLKHSDRASRFFFEEISFKSVEIFRLSEWIFERDFRLRELGRIFLHKNQVHSARVFVSICVDFSERNDFVIITYGMLEQ